MSRRIILVYPSARPSVIRSVIEKARSTTSIPLLIYVGYNGPNDGLDTGADQTRYFGNVLSTPGFIFATNYCYQHACMKFSVDVAELIGFWSDDFDPTNGWGESLYSALDANPSRPFLCPYDGIQEGQCATIPFATRWWWDTKNGRVIWPPIYRRFSCDDDIAYRAKLDNEFQYVPKCVIPHRHHIVGGRSRDEVDTSGDRHYQADKDTFNRRKPRIDKGERIVWSD
jgi:hypothetical protein